MAAAADAPQRPSTVPTAEQGGDLQASAKRRNSTGAKGTKAPKEPQPDKDLLATVRKMALNSMIAQLKAKRGFNPKTSSPPKMPELKMFGGVCILRGGNTMCGLTSDNLLIVRVRKDKFDDLIGTQGSSPMVHEGRALRGLLYVNIQMSDPKLRDKRLQFWMDQAAEYNLTLPEK